MPIDGMHIIIGVSAPYQTLVEEAHATRILMRMQETKGALEFHTDLIRYYARYGSLQSTASNRPCISGVACLSPLLFPRID